MGCCAQGTQPLSCRDSFVDEGPKAKGGQGRLLPAPTAETSCRCIVADRSMEQRKPAAAQCYMKQTKPDAVTPSQRRRSLAHQQCTLGTPCCTKLQTAAQSWRMAHLSASGLSHKRQGHALVP